MKPPLARRDARMACCSRIISSFQASSLSAPPSSLSCVGRGDCGGDRRDAGAGPSSRPGSRAQPRSVAAAASARGQSYRRGARALRVLWLALCWCCDYCWRADVGPSSQPRRAPSSGMCTQRTYDKFLSAVRVVLRNSDHLRGLDGDGAGRAAKKQFIQARRRPPLPPLHRPGRMPTQNSSPAAAPKNCHQRESKGDAVARAGMERAALRR